ncbi:hypothetical protein K443DRAFT_537744 [Laccaria amethystina LaAM-08-1]|uniref:Uncharacterized protein n=1 Tax=Laccaria amethystina LaAM-08-1 TaxID=1095629 RepID=A0A0C9X262_9AGAR|nr:hypothetical protein K443DRAFT_537744 [Laccaria amethystina LaAM-08-1]
MKPSQPPRPEHGRDLHLFFGLNSPSSTIARSEWPDHRGHSIRRHEVRLRLNIHSHTCNFPRTEVLRGSSAGRFQVPIYVFRRVLTLAVKLVRMSTGSIEIPMCSLAHPLPSPSTHRQ